MADSVLAIQQGFEFQAQYFWHKACLLYTKNSNITHVGWEIRDTPGFDDVAIYYNPAKESTYGYPILKEFFQVKFHVSHSNAFTCAALADPTFIGATSQSLLQKLNANYEASPMDYEKTLYTIVNTWGVDRKDGLYSLLDTQGAIRLHALFDGTGNKSKMGKIRKMWKEHLGLSNEEQLRPILRQLRIDANAKSGEAFYEEMNLALHYVGLQTVPNDKRVTPYANLIYRLHQEKRNYLSRDELMEILTKENLWETTTSVDVVQEYRIGVRSFLRGTESLEFETDDLLCLLPYFDGRYVKDEPVWHSTIVPKLSELSTRALAAGKPLVIHLDTHLTVAFTMGYLLDWRSGVTLSIVQKVRNGGRTLINLYTPGHVDATPQWEWSEHKISETGNDTVLIINVTHDILRDVKEYTQTTLTNISRILVGNILPAPNYSSIKDGGHIVQAVDEVVTKMRFWRTGSEKGGSLHVFMACPNMFAFCLGQASRQFGKLTMYEFDFENQRTGTYNQSISLPIK